MGRGGEGTPTAQETPTGLLPPYRAAASQRRLLDIILGKVSWPDGYPSLPSAGTGVDRRSGNPHPPSGCADAP